MSVITLVEIKKNPKIPDIGPGDTVKVSARIVEGGKERIQVFQGVVLKIKHGGISASFTVRHMSFGIGVERTFPMYSSLVEKVEIVREGKVRRSRLYYLRGLSGKEARRKIKRVERKIKQVGEELLQAPPEEMVEVIPQAPAEEKPVAAAAVETAPAAANAPEAAPKAAPTAEKKKAAAPKAEKKAAVTAPKAEKKEEAVPAPPQPAEEKKETT